MYDDEDAESDDDFKTMKDSEIGDDEQELYEEGQIIMENLYVNNDSVC